MTDVKATIEHLCNQVGPRRAGSHEESVAAEYISTRLRDLGLDPFTERFNVMSRRDLAQAAPFLVAWFASGYVACGCTLWGLPLSLLAFYLFYKNGRALPTFLTRFLSNSPSQNVYASVDSKGTPKRSLVISAQLDTPRVSAKYSGFLLSYITVFKIWQAAAIGVLPALSVWGLIFGAGWITWLAHVAGWYLLACAAVEIYHYFTGRPTAGAHNGAAPIAALLAAAEELTKKPLKNVEVKFLFTGGKQALAGGMNAYLDAHLGELGSKDLINIDSLGSGRFAYITDEGHLFSINSDRDLCVAANRAAEKVGIGHLTARPYRVETTDATPWLARGGRAVTLMAFDPSGYPPYYHSFEDTPDKLDDEQLDLSVKWIIATLRRLDSVEDEKA